MNLFALSGLLTFISTFALGIFTWIKKKTIIHKLWAFYNFSAAVWGFGAFKFSTTLDHDMVFFWLYFAHIGVILIPVFFLHFSMEFLREQKGKAVKLSYFIGIVFLIFNLTDWIGLTETFIVSIRYVFDSFYVDSPPGPIYPFFVVFFGLSVGYSFYCGLRKLKLVEGIKRVQIKYFLIAMGIGFAGGGTAFFMVFEIDIYPYYHLLVALYPIIVTYAIIKHRLMDIKVVVARGTILGIVYSLIFGLIFLSGFLFQNVLFDVFGKYMWIIPSGIAVILASMAPTVYSKLREKAEWTLFKQQKQYQQTLVNLGRQMTLTKNINDLLLLITRTVTLNVGISYTRIFIWDKEKKEYVFRKGYGKERRRQYDLKLDEDNPVIKYLNMVEEPVLKDEVINYFKTYKSEHNGQAEKFIRNTGAELIVPAFVESRMLGFMSLGPKNNNQIYTPEDIDMFRILSGQAALAIENAEFYERQKESQAMLVQASKMSSLGQLASGFAHNINNPFNAILVNAGCLKEALKEEEELSEDLKEDYGEYLESIIDSAETGGRIVSSITEFSKPSSGEKKRVEIEDIIGEAHKLTVSKLKQDDLLVDIDIPKELPSVKGDRVQLIQVFMNLFSNAADAVMSVEGEKEIKVRARKIGGEIYVRVKDTGKGISEKDKEKVFDYFFTTKRNAGTGLGLALSYQIVKAHGGDIKVKSEEGKGAEFEVILPVFKA